MTTSRYKIERVVRRSSWDRHRNRRGGKQVLYLVVDTAENRTASEHFRKRDAQGWLKEHIK